MKLIDNCTNLSNQDIGIILDKISKGIDTIYYGKVDGKKLEYKGKTIVVNIYYKKRYTKFDIFEIKENK